MKNQIIYAIRRGLSIGIQYRSKIQIEIGIEIEIENATAGFIVKIGSKSPGGVYNF